MTIFLVVYFLLFLFALIERIDIDQEKSGILVRKNFYVAIAIFLIIFAGLRYITGYDYLNYKAIYDNDRMMEPGFSLFMYISKNWFSLTFPYFMFFITGTSVLLKALFFYRYFRYPCLLLFLYYPTTYLSLDFGLIRQGVALGIFVWAIPAIKNRKLLHYILILLLAATFHYSILLMTPVYFANRFNFSFKKFLVFYFIGFVFVAGNGVDLILLITSKIMQGSFIGSLISYVQNYGEQTNLLYYFFLPNTVLSLLLITLFRFVYKNNKQINIKTDTFLMYNLYVISFLTIKYFSQMDIIQRRGSHFYKFFEIFLFYFILENLKEKESRALFLFIICIYGLLKIYPLITGSIEQFTGPYEIYAEFFGV